MFENTHETRVSTKRPELTKNKTSAKTLERHRDAICMSYQALRAMRLYGAADNLLESCHELYQEIGASVPVLKENK